MKKLLLHTCCAPCSIVIIDELKSQYDLTVFFYNPNIHPEEEYIKRKEQVIKLCDEWGVKMVDMDRALDGAASNPSTLKVTSPYKGEEKNGDTLDYGQAEWFEKIKGFEHEPEGGARCAQCFSMRLKRSAQYGAQHGYDIFATSLSSGRNKKALLINAIAERHAQDSGFAYLSGDWKKGGRQERGRAMVKERDIYRQDYCGCMYSRNM